MIVIMNLYIYVASNYVILLFCSAFLAHLGRKGFGTYHTKRDIMPDRKRIGQNIFFKPSPDTLTYDNPILKKAGVTYEVYRACFNDVSRMMEREEILVWKYHPHRELLDTIISQPAALTSSQSSVGSSGSTYSRRSTKSSRNSEKSTRRSKHRSSPRQSLESSSSKSGEKSSGRDSISSSRSSSKDSKKSSSGKSGKNGKSEKSDGKPSTSKVSKKTLGRSSPTTTCRETRQSKRLAKDPCAPITSSQSSTDCFQDGQCGNDLSECSELSTSEVNSDDSTSSDEYDGLMATLIPSDSE